MDENKQRFTRVYLTAIVPILLAALVGWADTVKAAPIVGVIAAALNVAYRRVNPLEGTSQFWRFVRVTVFVAAPTALAMANEWAAGVKLPIIAIVPALLETAYRQFASAYAEDDPEGDL